jgi:C-terminal processing protease CtpA/Prc
VTQQVDTHPLGSDGTANDASKKIVANLAEMREIMRDKLDIDRDEIHSTIDTVVSGHKIRHSSYYDKDDISKVEALAAEIRAIAAETGKTIAELDGGRMAAVKAIAEKTAAAEALIAECEKLANEHDIVFSIGIIGAPRPPRYEPGNGGWNNSSARC